MDVLVLTESELRQCVAIDNESLAAVENAFTWLQEGRVEMPPIMHIEVAENNGDVDIKSAYVRGLDRFAVKMGSGFFDNPSLGLPSSNAMMVMLSARTGFCEAVLLDNGYLTDLRTGLAGAVAAKYMAPEQVGTVGVIGCGAQARYQVQSLKLVRDFDRLLVAAGDSTRLTAYVEYMGHQLGVPVECVNSVEQLVRSSDVVVTTTPAREPLVQADWLHPGLHITAMGSDLSGKQELHPQVLLRADTLVCDRKSQCFSNGELQHALAAGLLDENSAIYELGELTSGRVAGRDSADSVTVCDLTGTGVQDTAIAQLAFERALTMGLGTRISQ